MTETKTADLDIVICRTFSAPPALVFAAWTRVEHLCHWLCPKDFTVLFAEVDLRPGGKWRSGMKAPDGEEYFMGGTYRTIEPPNRLVFTHAWEDEKADGHLPGHEVVITIQLTAVEGGTFMKFQVVGLTSIESRDGQTKGWSEAFENLNAHLLSKVNGS